MIPELEGLGFTRNEANVYAAALRLGSSSVQQLAHATGLNRITVHSIVEKFEGLQMFTRTYEGKRRRVSAVSPRQLDTLLKREEEHVREKRVVLESLLPSLEETYRRTQRGLHVSTFKGEQGFERICDDVLTAKSEVLEYADIDQLMRVIGPFVAKSYLPTKHSLQIRTKFLYVDSPSSRAYINKNYMDHKGAAPMQAKFIDPDEFSLGAYFVIYDDKLAILTPGTLDGVIIEDKAVADSLRPFFQFAWSRAGELVSNC